jgi:predicted nucleic acid-binding OB-fold protein
MLNDHVFRGEPFQKGYGLGDTFRRFFNWVIPIVKKHSLPALEVIGKRAIDTVADISKDVVSGKKFKESSEERINTSVEDIKKIISSQLQGKGKKKHILIKKRKNKQFEKFSDFFNKK